MVFKIAAIFIVILGSVGIFLVIFFKEPKSIIDIIGIIGVTINLLIILRYIIRGK